MSENKNMPAFPQSVSANEVGIYLATSANIQHNEEVVGVTKREYFAAKALQGLMAVNDKGNFDTPEYMIAEAARLSVIAADALSYRTLKTLTHEHANHHRLFQLPS